MPEVIVETDFHQWARDTAAAIQKREFADVDWGRVAEGLQSLGKSEHHQLLLRLAQLMYHLLKIQYQPERNTGSWHLTVKLQRRAIDRTLKEQPSLKATLTQREFWEEAYDDARALAGPENLPIDVVNQFPETCPFSFEILSNS